MGNHKRLAEAIIIVLLTLAVTVTVTSSLTTLAHGGSRYSISGQNESVEEFYNRYSRLNDVYTLLMQQYYKELDPDALLEGAINGMTATLNDPYTVYSTPEQMESLETERSGSYVGLGVEVSASSTGEITITRVFKKSPAEEAGLMKGDVISSADGLALSAKTSDELTEAVSHIKGQEGTFVLIGVKRGEESFEVSVERRSVVDSHVERYMLDEGIGYVHLYSFFGDAVSAFDEALEYFKENQARAIVLDLRDNGGGLLDVCIELSDRLLPEGVILYIEDRAGERLYYRSHEDCVDLPLAVLINENSASASEVMAGAIQDRERGVLVGKTSYGKGVVQSEYRFPEDGAGFKLTTSAYYTPNGRSIHNVGLTPDVEVEDEITITEPGIALLPENDAQLKAAYDYLLKQLSINADGAQQEEPVPDALKDDAA